MGKKDQTTTQETRPPEYIDAAYKDLLGRAGQVSQTPYDPNTERQVAGFAAPQTQAFGAVQNAQGIQSPYINQTGSYIQSGAAPISAQDISRYSNPFQQQVIDATMADLNRGYEIQQDQVVGNAALKNALGNSRVGVAQAELARGQGANTANILANLNQQNYNQALSAAQGDKARQFQAASQYGALGNQAQGAAYQDINALLGIGGQQQQQQQFGYDTSTANAQQAAQYPFNTTQWLAGITQGLGSSAGGTSTATAPGPSVLGQVAGLGLAAASMYSDERVKEDIAPVGKTFDGQTVFRYRYKGDPRMQMGLLAQEVETNHPEAVGSQGGIKTVNYDLATDEAANGFSGGGQVDPRSADLLSRLSNATRAVSSIRKATGGRTEPQGIGMPVDMHETSPGSWEPRQGFADGGMSVFDKGMYSATDPLFNALLQQESGNRNIQGPLVTAGANAGDRAMGPAQIMPKTAASPGYGVQPMDMNAADPAGENRRFGRDYLNAMLNEFGGDEEAALIAYNAGPGNAQKWLAAGRDYSVLPQQGQTEPYAENIMAMAQGGGPPAAPAPAGIGAPAPGMADPQAGIGTQQPTALSSAPPQTSAGSDGEWEINLPLLAAGLGMLGSQSPFPGVAIGQGGMQGVQMLMQQRQTKREAQKLTDAAKVAQERLGIQRESLDERKRHNLASEAQGSRAALSKNVIWGADEEGNSVILQASPEGELIRSKLPEGVKPIRDTIRVDAGDRWVLLDPVTRTKVGEEMKNLREAASETAAGSVEGKTSAEAGAKLPFVETATNRVLKVLDDLSNDDMREAFTGYSGYLPNVSPEANDYQASLDQVAGNVFLQAFNELRGGGAITEAEGNRATASLSRLGQIAPSDAGYQKALDDTRETMKEILVNARKRAGVTTPQESDGGQNDPLGIR